MAINASAEVHMATVASYAPEEQQRDPLIEGMGTATSRTSRCSAAFPRIIPWRALLASASLVVVGVAALAVSQKLAFPLEKRTALAPSGTVEQDEVTLGGFDAARPYQSRRKVWCDFHPCAGHWATTAVRGVNYGGRFVPEKYLGLFGTDEFLFRGIKKHPGARGLSLCDVDVADAGDRMARFLDANIKKEHFARMAELGFNVLRLPLGYWNLIDLPEGKAPNGPPHAVARWKNLQRIMNSSSYTKWIDMVFSFASQSGLKVLMDLHHVPGGNSGNQNTGCDFGNDGTFYFAAGGHKWDTPNTRLGVRVVEAMAKICAAKGDACYGIELLNEPFVGMKRGVLATFYDGAIRAARTHLGKEKPVIIMEWPHWLHYWKDHAMYAYDDYGHIQFASHFYQYPKHWTDDTEAARASFKSDLREMQAFFNETRYEIIVTEYALNSHGSGTRKDGFDYNGLTKWFVKQFDLMGFGAMIWNFDSWFAAWGPVMHEQVGKSTIEWKRINSGARSHPRGWGRGRGRGRGRGWHQV